MSKFDTIKGFLDSIHAGLFAVVILVTAWLIMAGTRRFAPSLWETMANLWWYKKLAIGKELNRFDVAMRKAWQGIPSAIVGAVMLAMMTGGDWREAAWGAGIGILTPIAYEARKAIGKALAKLGAKRE